MCERLELQAVLNGSAPDCGALRLASASAETTSWQHTFDDSMASVSVWNAYVRGADGVRPVGRSLRSTNISSRAACSMSLAWVLYCTVQYCLAVAHRNCGRQCLTLKACKVDDPKNCCGKGKRSWHGVREKRMAR